MANRFPQTQVKLVSLYSAREWLGYFWFYFTNSGSWATGNST
jgi:hypothetical protein